MFELFMFCASITLLAAAGLILVNIVDNIMDWMWYKDLKDRNRRL